MKTKKNVKEDSITRREFINKTAAGTAMIAFAPANTLLHDAGAGGTSWPADAPEYRFHMIGHAHIDPVWLWPWNEGMSVVHSTFRAALDRMDETPDFAFVASSAQFYEWVAENDPDMIKQIKKRIDEGRWNIVGGWWVEPDVNIPGGEAMVRQGLYGQKSFERLFGRKAKIGFNPDSFGHAGTLPQILKLQDMDRYVFMRPGPHEKEIPADLFWWESPDGSKVLTYRIPISYNETQPVNKRVKEVWERFHGKQPMKNYMVYYGAGDHGGGATKENIKSIEGLKTEKGAPKVFFSTMDRYFEEIEKQKLDLPTVSEDLQHHAQGCYTAEMEIKKGNRLSEAALITAEKIAALGNVAWGANYPKNEFSLAWQRVLFLQFHDSLAGTSLPEHSESAKEGYGYALDAAHQSMYKTVQKLEWQVKAEDPDSQYLIVFNPHAWETTSAVEYDFNWNDKHKYSRVEDENGNPLPHQWAAGTTETGSRKKLITEVALPPFGYRQIRLLEAEAPSVKGVSAKNNALENEYYKISFSENGEIGILDKETGYNVFVGDESGCKAIVIDDPSDTWSHGVKAFSDEIGEFGNAKARVVHNGPVKGIVRVVTTYGDSTLTIDWSLAKGSKKIEAKVTLDWHEKLKMLKFSFPVNVQSPESTYEVPYGHIIRKNDGDENPGQRWIDVSGTQNGKAYGFTVINDAKYGYNVDGNDMRISIARSAVFAHHRPKELDLENPYQWMDQGIHTFQMVLVPHNGSWQNAQVVRLAEELMAPPVKIYQGIHGGTLPKSGSFLSIDNPGVIVASIKQAEDNSDVIIRCVETTGQATAATLDLSFAGKKWKGDFKPCEIKTLRIDAKSGKITETNVLEEVS